ncbi:MAG: hypothetical protein IPL61_35600 [Myxococcales bacterium]|nr:hypothetical protein [Myxococcales bacterium]
MFTRWLPVLGLTVIATACSEPAPPEPVVARVDLRAALATADASPVGVAIDAAGARLVLDEQAGLWRVDAAGHATLVRALGALPDPGVPIRPPYTDLVALGDARFALTAIGDGFLLDLSADTMQQYFCYEPGGFPDDEEQRTAAVAYDPAAGRLYAQPRTFDVDGNLLRTELASYDSATGVDLSWRALPGQFDAGGMVALGGDALLLGAGDQLHRYDFATFTLTPVDDLGRFGVTAIDGLAIDPVAHTLVVVDRTRDELIEIALADLAL